MEKESTTRFTTDKDVSLMKLTSWFPMPDNWCSNTVASEAEGLRFKSRAVQIGPSVATATTFLRKELCCLQAQ